MKDPQSTKQSKKQFKKSQSKNKKAIAKSLTDVIKKVNPADTKSKSKFHDKKYKTDRTDSSNKDGNSKFSSKFKKTNSSQSKPHTYKKESYAKVNL